MKIFYKLLINNLIAGVINSFVWFALIFWVYIETKSVLATSIIGGAFMLFSALFGLYFGTYVDHHKKKRAMIVSSLISLFCYLIAAFIFIATEESTLLNISSLQFWLLTMFTLAGAVSGSMRMIALSTTVTMLVSQDRRDRANGLVGTVNGVAFTLTSVFSGLAIGLLNMRWVFGFTIGLTIAALLHLLIIPLKEKTIIQTKDSSRHIDVKGAVAAVQAVPGLLALIFFTTFNNFLGGVYMALMDPYGLSLVSVEIYGMIWAFISTGFIVGGLIVASKGLGRNPVKTILLANIVMWVLSIIFPIRSTMVLFAVCMFIYMCLIPVVEAAEQTVIQKVVPLKKQGRVFGFAQSVEQAATPFTTFLIGPLAQFVVIPFMTNGTGARTIGTWFGTGDLRAMALIFILAGLIGLVITIIALKSKSYRVLSSNYSIGSKSIKVGKDVLPDSPLV